MCRATLPRGALSRVPSVRWRRLTPQLPGEDESELSWCPQPLTYSTPLHIKGALEWSQATPASQPDNAAPPPPRFQQLLLALPQTHLEANDGACVNLENSSPTEHVAELFLPFINSRLLILATSRDFRRRFRGKACR